MNKVPSLRFLFRNSFFIPIFLATCLLISSPVPAQEDWSQEGLSHLKREQYTEAIEAFSKAIAEAYNNRGVAWHHKGDYEKAIADYNRALELHPRYAEALNNRGVARAYKGDYDKAIRDCTEATKINPSYADAYNNRGYAWQQKGDLDKAIVDYTETLDINPQYVRAYNSRGFAWAIKGDYDKAIADYDKALEIRPRYADVYNKRGSAWVQKGELEKAILDYTEAVVIDPEFENAYFNRAVVWTRQGNFEEAIADYTKAIAINLEYSEAYNQLARILAMCPDAQYRDGEKSLGYGKKAVERNPRAGTFDTLAAAHAEQGQFEDAVNSQKKAIRLLKEKGGTEECLAAYRERLKSYEARKPWHQTLAEAEYGQAGDLVHEESPGGRQASNQKIFSLQVDAFEYIENAERLTAQLKKKDYEAWTVPMTDSGGKVLHTVFCGKYASMAQAKEAAAALKKNENISPSIREIDTP